MVINFSIWFLAYLIGSIPFGVLFARSQGVDLRKHGSGNIGATNVARLLGKRVGALTLLGDTFKGWLAVSLASWVLIDSISVAGAGLMVFLGHLFSIFLKFKGGKGVATGLGIHLHIMPLAAFEAFGVFVLILLVSKYVSLSSIISAVALPVFGVFLNAPPHFVFLSTLIALLIIIKHQENVLRIINKTEPYFPKK